MRGVAECSDEGVGGVVAGDLEDGAGAGKGLDRGAAQVLGVPGGTLRGGVAVGGLEQADPLADAGGGLGLGGHRAAAQGRGDEVAGVEVGVVERGRLGGEASGGGEGVGVPRQGVGGGVEGGGGGGPAGGFLPEAGVRRRRPDRSSR